MRARRRDSATARQPRPVDDTGRPNDRAVRWIIFPSEWDGLAEPSSSLVRPNAEPGFALIESCWGQSRTTVVNDRVDR